MQRFFTALLGLGLAAGPALAGSIDPPADPIVQPPESDWSGPYVGVQLGFGDFDMNGVIPGVVGAVGPTPVNLSDDGPVFGIHAGYNWDRGTLVYGVEADIDFPDISFGATDVDNIARLKLRLGVDANRAFVYATAGAAHLDGGGGGLSISDWGWVAGAGVDFKMSEKWIVGADALYHAFDDVSPIIDVDGMTYRLRVSYRF